MIGLGILAAIGICFVLLIIFIVDLVVEVKDILFPKQVVVGKHRADKEQ